MDKQLSRGAARFQSRLEDLGHEHKVEQFTGSVKTAEEAAAIIGCEPEQVAKTTVYQLENAKEALIVVTSGDKRINEMIMEILVDDELIKPDEEFVESMTGYSMNAVPPLAHNRPIMTFIDEDLQDFDAIWAIGGDENAFLKLTPTGLKSMTLAEVVQVGFSEE